MYHGHCLTVQPLAGDFVELCFDREDGQVNRLDDRTIAELEEATCLLSRGAAAGTVNGVLVTSAKTGFVADIDLRELRSRFSRPAADIAEFDARRSSVLAAFEDLTVPTVAAIDGPAIGVGLAVALAADFRILTHDSKVGFPEVALGHFPGCGATVRLPRLIGGPGALEWITSGSLHSAADAVSCGVAGSSVTSAELRDAAMAWLQSSRSSGSWQVARTRRLGPVPDWDRTSTHGIRARAQGVADRNPAALAAVDLVEECAILARDDALVRGAAAFGHIACTSTARALIQLSINEQVLNDLCSTQARIGSHVQRAAILGAGIMGGGIAYTSALRGINTIMKDIQPQALDAGLREADRLLSRQVDGGKMSRERAADVRSRIVPTLEDGAIADADIVIEAIVENLSVKQAVLADVEARIRASTIVASNTSSLSIDEIAATLKRPDRFGGMHFFNPVPQMPLVEVIRGSKTSDATVSTLVSFALKLGKTPIVLRDCPGFLVNRLLNAYYVGFCKLIRDGADFERVDEAMEAFGWPMGPAYLQDVVGMDTSSHVADLIAAGYPSRQSLDFETPMRRMVSENRLGQKNGRGFYAYTRGPTGRLEKRSDPSAREIIAAMQPQGPKAFSAEDIVDRLMIPMVLEAVSCLEDGIVQTAAEVDMALVLGTGFPRHRCGALAYADSVGLASIIRKCDRYAALGGGYQPSAMLRNAATTGELFYP